MFSLTDRGKEELERFLDASEDELRLTRRTLIMPLLEAVSRGVDSFEELREATGYSRYELTGLLRAPYNLGYIERVEPGPEAPSEEKRSWYMYQLGQRRGPKVESRTKEQLARSTKISMERYPEVAERNLADFRLRSQRKWFERHGGERAYREGLKRKEEGGSSA